MVANYAAFYSGNFIASLNALEAMLAERGVRVSYVFPKNAPFANWGEDGRYLEHYDVHTADFTPAALAAKLKTMVQTDENDKQSAEKTSSAGDKDRSGTVKLMQFDVLTAHTVIHMHFLDWKGIGVITRALRHENVTLVAQEHMRMDFGREQMKRTLVRRAKDWLKQRLYRYATRDCQMIGVSDAVYQDLCRIRGEYAKTYLVRNAISTRRLDGAWDNALSLDPMRDVVIFGTHFERKGVDVALRAVMKAKSRLRLVVLTHREAETQAKLDAIEPEWRNYAAVHHVVENIASVYNYALCFLSPSRSEAFGYAVVEAAYCDTQVIASDIPGQNSIKCVPDVRWVHAEEADELAEALDACHQLRLTELEKLQAQKEEQRNYIRTHFGVESWCEEIMQVYGVRSVHTSDDREI